MKSQFHIQNTSDSLIRLRANLKINFIFIFLNKKKLKNNF